jgi:hypothetical protein
MFDNLRQQSLQETEQETDKSQPRTRSKYTLGLNPMQRCVLALVLFLDTTVMGCFALIVLDKVIIP